MKQHVFHLLPELVMDILSEECAEAVCTHLQTCAKCTAEWNSLREASTTLARVLAPEEISESVRNRILRSAEGNNPTHTSVHE